jgi:alkanesulfonate monooxygenase SsuD/methylene tetrahydromethanopterin reductase-like flavin-dependent oxidoreductase (luciferase family)
MFSTSHCATVSARQRARGGSGGLRRASRGRSRRGFAPFCALQHAALGVDFPPLTERRRRLLDCCQVLPQLWRGEEISHSDLGLTSASLGPIEIEPPPIFVGGTARETMAIAASDADGWNAVVADAARFAELADQVDQLCGQLGRAEPLRKAVQVFVRDIELAKARDLIADLEVAALQRRTGQQSRPRSSSSSAAPSPRSF